VNAEEIKFYGQQEGEVVLYEIRPHWTRKATGLLLAGIITLLGFGITHILTLTLAEDPTIFFARGLVVSLIIGGMIYGWFRFTANRARAFITDRRFVRLEVAFPVFINRRSLFWSEVLKVKGYAPNILLKSAKVGTLAVQPMMSESKNEDVRVSHVYYFGDLANYMDKILYLQKNDPEGLKNIRPFVPKPAGERF
jgi:hypothetical protein